MPDIKQIQQNKEDIAVLSKEVKLEIQGLKGAFQAHGDLLKEVSNKLGNIFNKLQDFVVTHQSFSDRLDGLTQSIRRVDNDVINLQQVVNEKASRDELNRHLIEDEKEHNEAAKRWDKLIWIGGIGMGVVITLQVLLNYPQLIKFFQ